MKKIILIFAAIGIFCSCHQEESSIKPEINDIYLTSGSYGFQIFAENTFSLKDVSYETTTFPNTEFPIEKEAGTHDKVIFNSSWFSIEGSNNWEDSNTLKIQVSENSTQYTRKLVIQIQRESSIDEIRICQDGYRKSDRLYMD